MKFSDQEEKPFVGVFSYGPADGSPHLPGTGAINRDRSHRQMG